MKGVNDTPAITISEDSSFSAFFNETENDISQEKKKDNQSDIQVKRSSVTDHLFLTLFHRTHFHSRLPKELLQGCRLQQLRLNNMYHAILIREMRSTAPLHSQAAVPRP